MLRLLTIVVLVLVTNLANAGTGIVPEKNTPANQFMLSSSSVLPDDESETPLRQCGTSFYYATCCGRTVTCGWISVCVDNGVVVYLDQFSACMDPALCVGMPPCGPTEV